MATHKIIVSYAMIKKAIPFFEGLSDDTIKSAKLVAGPKGIKATFEVESDLPADEAAAYMKKKYTSAPGNANAYISVQPDGFFG